MTKRVYIDTSVVGGQFDEEFSAGTIPFFEVVEKGFLSLSILDTAFHVLKMSCVC